MSPCILVGLVLSCAARVAAAERPIVVDEAAGAPFAASELASAIRVRVPAEGAPVRVRVTTTASGVRIEARGGTREVELAGLHGEAAARMVALAANDLLLDDLAIAPPVPFAIRARGERPAIGVLGAVARWDGLLGGLAIDLTLPRDGWQITVDVGGAQLVDSALKLTAGIVRLDAGLRAAGAFELRGGITLAPLLVTSGIGDQTVLVGGNASVRARIPIAPGVRGVLAAGADVFATRTTYYLAGAMPITTPQIAPWVAVGVEVGL